MNALKRPTVGLALSGSGSRLIFYIGFLEELDRLKVPVDYIAAMSGASIVATAYACGRLPQLKELVFALTKEQILEMLPKGRGGLYSLDVLEEYGRIHISGGLNFENVRPLLGFVSSDIETGEQIVLSMGDLARAVRISCTLPFFFEAVKWGGRTLIDGGLLNRIPIDVVKDAGMDVVVGVNMRGTPHLFTNRQLAIKKTYNFFKKILMIEYLERAWDALKTEDDEFVNFDHQPPMLSVLAKSMDLALEAGKRDSEHTASCDLLITPDIKGFTIKNIETKKYDLYELGKTTAQQYASKILELIEQKRLKKEPIIERK